MASDVAETVYIDVPEDGNALSEYLDGIQDALDSLVDSNAQVVASASSVDAKLDDVSAKLDEVSAKLDDLQVNVDTVEVTGDESCGDLLTQLCGIGGTSVGLQVVSVAVCCLLLGVLLGKVLVDHWTVHPK